MANCKVPPFLGCCAPASEIVLPKATAAAPVIRTERLVKPGFIAFLPQVLLVASPREHAIRLYGRPRNGPNSTAGILGSRAGTLRRRSDSVYGKRTLLVGSRVRVFRRGAREARGCARPLGPGPARRRAAPWCRDASARRRAHRGRQAPPRARDTLRQRGRRCGAPRRDRAR